MKNKGYNLMAVASVLLLVFGSVFAGVGGSGLVPPSPPGEKKDSTQSTVPFYTLSFQIYKGWNFIYNPLFPIIKGKKYPDWEGGIISTTCDYPYPINTFMINLNQLSSSPYQFYQVKDKFLVGLTPFWLYSNKDCKITVGGYPHKLVKSKVVNPLLEGKDPIFQLPKTEGWAVIANPYVSKKISWDELNNDCELIDGPYRYLPKLKKYVKEKELMPGVGYFVKVSTKNAITQKLKNIIMNKTVEIKILCYIKKFDEIESPYKISK